MSKEAYFGRFDNAATETVDDILAEMWIFKCRNLSTGELEECTAISKCLADRIEAAHKRELETKDSVIQTLSAARDDELDRHRREMEALKRRRSELDAEVAAKDEVIKRLDAEIRKYQEERELRIAAQKAKAAAEGYADGKRDEQVGNAAKLREVVIETQSAIAKCMDILNKIPECGYNALIDDVADELCDLREEHIKTALAAPPRNCDKYENDNAIEQFEREILGKEAATTYERLENMRENWFRYNSWLFEKAKESEVGK